MEVEVEGEIGFEYCGHFVRKGKTLERKLKTMHIFVWRIHMLNMLIVKYYYIDCY